MLYNEIELKMAKFRSFKLFYELKKFFKFKSKFISNNYSQIQNCTNSIEKKSCTIV